MSDTTGGAVKQDYAFGFNLTFIVFLLLVLNGILESPVAGSVIQPVAVFQVASGLMLCHQYLLEKD